MTIAPAFLIICNSCGTGGPIPGFVVGPGQVKCEMPPGWTEKSSSLVVAGQAPQVTHCCPECVEKAAAKKSALIVTDEK